MSIGRIYEVNLEKTYRVYRMDFHSLSTLELYLESNPEVNRLIFPSQKSIEMPETFAGAKLEQAIEYCHGGYESGFEMFLKLRRELENVSRQAFSYRRSIPSVVGSRPHVPNFLAGTPKTMFRLERAKEKKFIDVYINLAYSGDTTEDQIRNRGILALNLIRLLEQNDYAVNLYAFEASYLGSEIFIADIRLKRPGEPINIGKCYYPLCGKEFIRRLIVRVKESMPFREKWGVGYGKVLSEDMVRKVMKIKENTIVIPSPLELGLRGYNIYDDGREFFSKLNLLNMIVVPEFDSIKKRKKNG